MSETTTAAAAYRRNLFLAAPFAIAAPIVIGLVLVAWGAGSSPAGWAPGRSAGRSPSPCAPQSRWWRAD